MSSQVVYGNPNKLNIIEEHPITDFPLPYAMSKINSETYIKNSQKKFNNMSIILRLSGFIEGGGIIKYIKEQAENNLPINLYSKGDLYRDYLSIHDGINAICATLKYKNSNSFIPINVGSGQLCSIKDLALFICKSVNSSSKIKLVIKPAPIGNLTLNIKKAQKKLNYKPKNIFESIKDYIANS